MSAFLNSLITENKLSVNRYQNKENSGIAYPVKNKVSYFLLFVFLFNIAGCFGLFAYLKHLNRESVFNRGRNELNLVRLTIPKTEKIHWENKNEIVYRGNYYDVFQTSEDDKNILLLCYSDTKESAMTEVFNRHLSAQQSENAMGKPGSNYSVRITMQEYLLNNFVWDIHTSSAEKFSKQISNSCVSGFVSVFSPPPESV